MRWRFCRFGFALQARMTDEANVEVRKGCGCETIEGWS